MTFLSLTPGSEPVFCPAVVQVLFFRILLPCLVLLVLAPSALAQSLTLGWDPPKGSTPAGYRVRYGPADAWYTQDLDVGKNLTAQVDGLEPGVTYDFQVVAYHAGSSLVSWPSNIVRYTVPGGAPPPSGGGKGGDGKDGRDDDEGEGGGGSNDREAPAAPAPEGLDASWAKVYLAEGVSSSYFQTTIAIANPSTGSADARILLRPDGPSHMLDVPVPPLSHVETDATAVLGTTQGAFGVTVGGTATLGVARATTWDGARGGHAELATSQPSRRWYFAEGSTAGPFELFLLLLNPGDTDARVGVTFLRTKGAPIKRTYTIGPGARLSVWVDQEHPDLLATDVAAIVESEDGPAIVAERAMYMAGAGGFVGGHASLGTTAPRNRWLMAEGATGTFFNLFVMLANPDSRKTAVTLRFRRPDGLLVTHKVTLKPMQRKTVEVAKVSPLLADTAVWTEIDSGKVPIVAERVMWWPGNKWTDGHVASAADGPSARWLAVGGRSGGSRAHRTYVLIANTEAATQDVRVTVLGPAGPAGTKVFSVPKEARFNVDMSAMFPTVQGAYSVLVETVSGAKAIVVEQATYWDANGKHWAAGTAIPALAIE